MSTTTVEIILTLPNRLSAKLAMVKVLGLRKALAYRGPTFEGLTERPIISDGVVLVKTDDRTAYCYPLNTVARVKCSVPVGYRLTVKESK